MNRYQWTFWLITIVFLSSADFAASSNYGDFTWVTQSDTSIIATFTAVRCMDSNGTQDLNVRVIKQPTGKADTNATVTAIVSEADGDTNSITFNNQNDGNYTFTYTFDVNGTYKFQITADNNTTVNDTYDLNDYIYVRDFSINISFLNNNAEYSAGSTVTIRNLVVNDDGNAFNDLNSSIDVFYPNASALHSSQEMTGLGNGEYIFSFIAPSTTGTYSATSTFSCSNESASNSSGRFTVPAAASPQDPGGGGGGGGGGGSVKLKASIKDFSLEPLELGAPVIVSLSVLNEMMTKKDFLVKLEILKEGKLEFYSEQLVLDVVRKKTEEVIFAEKWVPKIAGTYVATVTLLSSDKKVNYYSETLKLDIEGNLRYDLEIICSKDEITSGLPYYFNIIAYNLGDYYEDVELSWWLEDEKQQKIGFASVPVAITPEKSLTRMVLIFIPTNISPGVYTARTRLVLKDVTRDSFCSFLVRAPEDYYSELLSELEHQIQGLEEDLKTKKEQGVVVDYIVEELNELKEKYLLIKEKVNSAEYADLDRDITDLFAELNDLRDLSEKLEKEAAIDIRAMLFSLQTFLVAIFLITIITLLYGRRKGIRIKGVKKFSLEKKIEKLLGLDD